MTNMISFALPSVTLFYQSRKHRIPICVIERSKEILEKKSGDSNTHIASADHSATIAYLEAGRAGGCWAHFCGIDAKFQMSEVGLSEGHEPGVKISPNEEKKERNGREILVGDRVDYGESEINSKGNFRVRHPAGLVAIFFRNESIFFAFYLKFWSARELAFHSEDGFEHRFGIADGDADARGHDEWHIEKCTPPGFRAKLFLRDQIKAGDGASGSEEQRQIDEQHLQPALIKTNDHRGKQHRGK